MTEAVLTKRAIIERGVDALDPQKLAIAAVRHEATQGRVSRVNLPQVIEVAKFMAAAGDGVPAHLRGNVGMCLRITFQAVEWEMSPFSVADMSFVVGGRLAYQSQLLHAVVLARAPLQHRLRREYEGEGDKRTCTVTGHFISGDVQFYTTPPLGQLKKKGHSPLYQDDPDTQQWYFGTRRWARMFTPDVLLGCYTREEIQQGLGREEEGAAVASLRQRLAGAVPSDEGHSPGFAARELASIAGGGQTIDLTPSEGAEPEARAATGSSEKGQATSGRGKAKKRATGRAKGKAETAVTEGGAEPSASPGEPRDESGDNPGYRIGTTTRRPRNIEEYDAHARRWISLEESVVALGQQWNDERKLRNDLGMTAEDRSPLEALIEERKRALAANDDGGPDAA